MHSKVCVCMFFFSETAEKQESKRGAHFKIMLQQAVTHELVHMQKHRQGVCSLNIKTHIQKLNYEDLDTETLLSKLV